MDDRQNLSNHARTQGNKEYEWSYKVQSAQPIVKKGVNLGQREMAVRKV